MEAMAICGDVDREDREDFYSRWSEEVTTGDIGKGEGVGKEELSGSRVCSSTQSSTHSVERGRVVQPEMAMLEGKVLGEEEQEVKVVVDIKDGELIVFERSCKWEEETVERRWRGEDFYSPPMWTLHVSTPAQLSRSLLWPSILSNRSGTCILMENCGGIRSFQSHTLLLLLLNQGVEMGSSGHGLRFLSRA